ncbi:nicotinamide phosphoribosyltransferase [Ralstonia phage RSP15]|uniref:nicotinamide phosphoribosyl transferase n=1 Tax=Ralstonia phage RSP15 TaxID=1785960 RepID=UPI00074D3A1E|nr:nicotinamide phosphoribosyl transferase [Ralstonia phage RSP15]BAU39980.1 nicotinamide phosphoribosyltransferase [Ralstonia phage RSP15]
MNLKNIWMNTDGYKPSMAKQYPPRTKYVFSYISSRGGKYPDIPMFGLQAFIREYLAPGFTLQDVEEAEFIMSKNGAAYPAADVRKLFDRYQINGVAHLPVKIWAVPEGTKVGTNQVMVTIVNMDADFPWLTTYLETAILRAVWYPSTVLANSYASRRVIRKYLEETGTPELLDYKHNDFGARGATCLEQAGLGGMAHFASGSKGSDTLIASLYAKKYYNHDYEATTIAAMEHSTVTSWGRDFEENAFRNMLAVYKDNGILAMVCDSYDVYNAAHIWGRMKDAIIESGAMCVFRPDSGDPLEVIPKVLGILESYFGSTVNQKGYKVLNHNVRMIWGDGITTENIEMILFTLAARGWSADNIAFGQGGALLQDLQRDTNKWAMKCSTVFVEGDGWRDVFKDPITDPGKKSMKGLLGLMKDDEGNFVTVNLAGINDKRNIMLVVYDSGELLNQTTLKEVIARVNS